MVVESSVGFYDQARSCCASREVCSVTAGENSIASMEVTQPISGA